MIKNFPIDYTKDEIVVILSDLSNKLEKDILTEGQKITIERKMMVCQNQLVFSSLIESNEKLSQQQQILVRQQETLLNQQETLANLFIENSKTNKRTGKEAKLIIFLTIVTLLATSMLELYHMHEENENQKTMIKQLEELINKDTHVSPKEILIPKRVKQDTLTNPDKEIKHSHGISK